VTHEDYLRLTTQYWFEAYRLRPTEIAVTLENGRVYTIPVPLMVAAVMGMQAPSEAPPIGNHGPDDPVDGVPADLARAIFRVLGDNCKRYTRSEMTEAVNAFGTTSEHSESAVEKALWQLRKVGRLSNQKDNYGKGFGLPEWSRD
jgi:hypothetical protein